MEELEKLDNFYPFELKNPEIPINVLDKDALSIIKRLKAKGFEAYLVGGCVRDLLLGIIPKDFDVATSARPRQVKKNFRNCRIIGKRFKLAHVYFGDKIIEVSTFRRTPEGLGENGSDDLLIRTDNFFGTAREDAQRRDFTINSLFYDPFENKIIDWVGGLHDLRKRRIRTIGDPWIRFKEDPVRIMRAIKFSTRLGFDIEDDVWDAMIEVSHDLQKSAPPRILEEIFRLLRSGNSLEAFQLLRDTECLEVIIPELSKWLKKIDINEKEIFWRHLEALDAIVQTEYKNPSNAFLLSVLFVHMIQTEVEKGKDPNDIIEKVFTPFALWTRLSKKERAKVKKICAVQKRFSDNKKRFNTKTFLSQDYFEEAIKLFHLRCLATGKGWQTLNIWKEKKLVFDLGFYNGFYKKKKKN